MPKACLYNSRSSATASAGCATAGRSEGDVAGSGAEGETVGVAVPGGGEGEIYVMSQGESLAVETEGIEIQVQRQADGIGHLVAVKSAHTAYGGLVQILRQSVRGHIGLELTEHAPGLVCRIIVDIDGTAVDTLDYYNPNIRTAWRRAPAFIDIDCQRYRRVLCHHLHVLMANLTKSRKTIAYAPVKSETDTAVSASGHDSAVHIIVNGHPP